MSLVEAVIMGLIQGLTEFLPVSSSGHMALFKILFGIETDTGFLFDVLLHIGTLMAVFIVYYKDIFEMIAEGFKIIFDFFTNVGIMFCNLFSKKKRKYRKVICNSYRKFVMLIIISTIPTGIVGYVGADFVEDSSAVLWIPGVCLIITAILLFLADRMPDGKKLPEDISYTNGFVIGILQGIATMPGISRSGMTITSCLFSGFERSFAVKYSFIMSIPAILGALVLELKDAQLAAISMSDKINYGVGMLVSAVVGYICIKTMLVVVRKKKFKIFSIYCLLVGTVAIAGYFTLA